MQRAAGVLLHPTSLPGAFCVGDLGPEALVFLDWLESAGQRYWQVLPLGPVSDSGSPYDSFSAFAGNPLLISPELLVSAELIDPKEVESSKGMSRSVDFAAVRASKTKLLRSAWACYQSTLPPGLQSRFQSFRDEPEVAEWLENWALFAALKQRFNQRPWHSWPAAIRRRERAALDATRQELASEIDFHRFVQFLFFDQWHELRRQAADRGIHILGDLAIYLSLDSADVWANQEIFDLDSDGQPRAVAGVPPDYFSATGQRWGNPLYRWDRLQAAGFDWWIKRLGWSLRHADLVRVDHFRGFAAYWEVPANEETAIHGRWLPGPGLAFFTAAEEALGKLALVAEDLGVITDDVTALRQAVGIPGMRVLQFAFSEPSSDHRPHRVPPDTVFYTGTHDNDTARGWYDHADAQERQRVLDYLGPSQEAVSWRFIRAVFTSVAKIAVTPLQDVLDLPGEARLNTPGRASGQWSWRLQEQPPMSVADRLHRLAAVTDRLPSRARTE